MKIKFSIGEGNGNSLQYSCLENPMDEGAWWATVHGLQRVGHDWATSLHFIPLYKFLFAYLPSVPRIYFNIFCNAGILVMNCLIFCLSKEINILPSIKKCFYWLYKCDLINQQSFLVIVSHNFGIQFWLGSARLFSFWVSPVLTCGPWLIEAIEHFLTHMPGGWCWLWAKISAELWSGHVHGLLPCGSAFLTLLF